MSGAEHIPPFVRNAGGLALCFVVDTPDGPRVVEKPLAGSTVRHVIADLALGLRRQGAAADSPAPFLLALEQPELARLDDAGEII